MDDQWCADLLHTVGKTGQMEKMSDLERSLKCCF